MGCAGDRDFRFVQVRARTDDRERLEGFRRTAEQDDQPGVTDGRYDVSLRDGDRMNAMTGLDDSAAHDLDEDRLHGAAA